MSTSTRWLLLLLLLFIVSSTLNTTANINAHNSILTASTKIIIEISMINATIPSIIINTGVNHCRTVLTTIAITVVVITITTIITITNTRLLFLLLLTVFVFGVSTNPIVTTSTTSIISNICVNSSDRSSAITTIAVAMVGIKIQFTTTNYCCSHYY